MLKFLPDRALYISSGKEKILVIADLHLGRETTLFRKGITIPPQTEFIKARLNHIIRRTRATHLIVLGDIKDNVYGTTRQEEREIPKFFSDIIEAYRTGKRGQDRSLMISLIKGNHDSNIEKLFRPKKDFPNIKVYPTTGFRLGDCAFTHGQAWISKPMLKAKILLIGHLHPAINFFSSGFPIKEHIWLRCPIDKAAFERKYKTKTNLEEAIVVPSFNHLTGGFPLNSKGRKPLGPLMSRGLKWKQGDVYLLDGTHLGKLNDL